MANHNRVLLGELMKEKKKKYVEDLVEKLVEYETFDEWHEPTLSYITDMLEKAGFNGIDISYSGFWSQGDGASFTGNYLHDDNNIYELLKEFPQPPDSLTDLLGYLTGLNAKVTEAQTDETLNFSLYRSSYHYSHENTVSVDYDYLLEGMDGEDVRTIEEKCRAVMKDMYRMLEDDYDYLTSEKHILEVYGDECVSTLVTLF